MGIYEDIVEAEDDEQQEEVDGRRPKAYVRFERMKERHSGPMYGPFAQLSLKQDAVTGTRTSGKNEPIAHRKHDGNWYLDDFPQEPGYPGFVVLFS